MTTFFPHFAGGVADRVGGLKRGDQLLSVNGVSVEGEHHEKAVELLKAAIGKCFSKVKISLVISTAFEFSRQKLDNKLLENSLF